ncbi:MAG: hypothetical protein K0S24_3059 [Sphingobacterium sp.]|jgi:hypothetical protein|nr:hypothetical protein [Sphingobacterium sp.]
MDAARIKRVVERIARGIYYKKTGSIMPLSWRLDIDWLDVGDKVKKVFSQSKKVVSFANGTFKYYWYEDSLTFHLLFFDVTYFRVKGRSSKMKSFHG